MATKPHSLRRTVLINPAIQLKYFAIFSFLGGGLSALWGTVILSVIHQDEVKLGLASEDSSLVSIHGGMFWWFAGVVVALTVLIGIAGLFITHRIAGPVFVMRRAMDSLTTGKYPHLRPLRKSDDLNDLYASFRALIDSLLKTDRDELAAIERALELVGGASGEASTLLRELHTKKLERVGSAAAPEAPKELSPQS